VRSRWSRDRKNRRRGDDNRIAYAAGKRAPNPLQGFLKVNRLDADEIQQRALRKKTGGTRAAGALAVNFDESA